VLTLDVLYRNSRQDIRRQLNCILTQRILDGSIASILGRDLARRLRGRLTSDLRIHQTNTGEANEDGRKKSKRHFEASWDFKEELACLNCIALPCSGQLVSGSGVSFLAR
jgi:hypothetical protein